MIRTFTHRHIGLMADVRPAGYRDDLMRCAVSQDERGATFDTGSDCWKSLVVKYAARGLGDRIARVTAAAGIPSCGGCKKRQAALNKAVPYRDGSNANSPRGS